MGIGPSYKSSYCKHLTPETKTVYIDRPVYIDSKPLPNPNPKNFIIQQLETINDFVIALIKYPDCNNYEGIKILIYWGIPEERLKSAKVLDPHFCNNELCISPIARFEPTKLGWEMAEFFCKNWSEF